MTNPNSENFHLFLSHHSEDKTAARAFAEQLRNHGLRVWFDEWELLPGDDFSQAIEEVLRTVPAAAVLVGPTGIGPWEQLEINVALIQSVQRGLRVIPVLLPGAPTRPELPLFLQCFTWLDLHHGFDSVALDRLKLAIPGLQTRSAQTSTETTLLTLPEVLLRAQKRLIISGHTLDKFTRDIEVQAALLRLLARGVRLSVIQLNPLSRYALAHQPYHELESTSSAAEQHDKTLQFLDSVFENMDPSRKGNLEVIFANYMPRFRTIIVDDAVLLYFYMSGVDVPQTPDIILEPSAQPDRDLLRQRVIYSTLKLLTAPEVVPYISPTASFNLRLCSRS